jgi:hypothetical protein
MLDEGDAVGVAEARREAGHRLSPMC